MHPFMSPVSPIACNDANISDEMREKALKRTTDVLQKLNEIRRKLEMPAEQLPIVIETYNKVVAALIAEVAREELAKRTKRLPFAMQSETRDCQPMKIARGKPVQVIGRPQMLAFRPEDIAIHGDRARWLVHDILVGGRSQFVQSRGPTPGTEFGPGGILEHLRLETLQIAMDFKLVVEYVGPEPDGEVFEATIVGTVVEF
jgi:hypothetical protein